MLISLDTTRADQLGCYGNARVSTPHLDRLAAQGVRFADVTAPAPTTLASHTSLMTGTYAHTHGVVRNGFAVHPRNDMLAEVLERAGFHTAAFLGSFALESRFGFDQGFQHFDETFDLLVAPGVRDQNQRLAAAVTDAVLEHVDRQGGPDSRLFLFAHYFDAHAPFAPPAPWDRAYVPEDARRTSDRADLEAAVRAQQRAAIGRGLGLGAVIGNGLPRELIERARGQPLADDPRLAGLHAGEISYVDFEVGRLLDGLEERGLLEQTLVVLCADHGETFWEHGDFWNHGLWLYQTTVQVPLIFRLPDGQGAGRVVERPVSLVDVAPTLCELLGLPRPTRSEGTSLVPALRGEPLERGPVFSEATQPTGKLEYQGEWGNRFKPRAVRQGPWKYVQAPYLRLEQLFHLGRDPGETDDLLRSSPDAPEVRQVLSELRGALLEWTSGAQPLPSSFDTSQGVDTLQRLRQMGYVGDR